MTAAEFLALPDDGTDRELINGVLLERPMTYRNPTHSTVIINIGHVLKRWSASRKPRGRVVGGEAGFRIRKEPDTIVGIDVAYVGPELSVSTPAGVRVFEGVPVLAVEVLSPSDRQEEVFEKVRSYLAAGVSLVWEVEPEFRTVTVYRPDALPQLFNLEQEITAEPHLPGFRVPVAELFEDA